MKSYQDLVHDYHVEHDYPTSPAPIEMRDAELRANLMAEEPIETVVALVGPARAQTVVVGQLLKAVEKATKRRQTEPSLLETIDGCMDSLYVTFGTMETLGFTSEETQLFYEEVHRSNMAKIGGGRDESGKTKKPDGWTPPDIEGVLERVLASRQATREQAERFAGAIAQAIRPRPNTNRAAVCLVKRGDRYLCVWNGRYGGWSFPGGKVEEGETSQQAAGRELLEETHLHVIGTPVQVFEGPHGIVVDSTRGSVVTVFRVDEYVGEPVEAEIGRPVTWLTREEFMKWSPFAPFYERVFANMAADSASTPIRQNPPPKQSCPCDGALDDGCYNCTSEWRCGTCGFPLAFKGDEKRKCLYCAGARLTDEEWIEIAHTGRAP